MRHPHKIRISRLALAALLVVATGGLAQEQSKDENAVPPALDELRQCARAAWRADIERLADYAFDRHVVLQDVDKNGEVTDETRRRFRLTPKGDGSFDELLITEDGRPPTEREIRKFRDKAIFSGNYENAETLELDNPLGEDLVLLPVLGRQNHVIVGEDEVDGVPCYRTKFEAGADPGRASTEEQLANGIRGAACLAIDGCHVVLLEFESVRPIKQGIARIESIDLRLEMQPVEDGWVIDRFVAKFDFAALGKHVRRTSTYTYSNFDRYPPASD